MLGRGRGYPYICVPCRVNFNKYGSYFVFLSPLEMDEFNVQERQVPFRDLSLQQSL